MSDFQLELKLGSPTARKDDPETSKIAARSVKTGSIRFSILKTIEKHGAGMTTFELALEMNQPRDYISPHLKPLERIGYVRNSGRTRINKATKSKVSSIIWELTDQYFRSPQAKIADLRIELKRRAHIQSLAAEIRKCQSEIISMCQIAINDYDPVEMKISTKHICRDSPVGLCVHILNSSSVPTHCRYCNTSVYIKN